MRQLLHHARVYKKTKKVNTVSVCSHSVLPYPGTEQLTGDTHDIMTLSDEPWAGTVKCAKGNDQRLIVRGRFVASMEYNGLCATSDVYSVHQGCKNQAKRMFGNRTLSLGHWA
uniref:Uncharacterized protein n=1 Tax=Pristionchus pacificus TaxID=54126 RepID=A0A8R1Z2S0_PRIPA